MSSPTPNSEPSILYCICGMPFGSKTCFHCRRPIRPSVIDKPQDPEQEVSRTVIKKVATEFINRQLNPELVKAFNQLTPTAARFAGRGVNIQFLTYPEDKTIRLFQRGQILGEIPAGYSEEKVCIKVRVTTPSEDFAVILDTTRTQLDSSGGLDYLAEAAYNLSHTQEKDN